MSLSQNQQSNKQGQSYSSVNSACSGKPWWPSPFNNRTPTSSVLAYLRNWFCFAIKSSQTLPKRLSTHNLNMSLEFLSILQFVFSLALIWISTVIVYRLYFHPLSRFPGPKLAIATYLYEWYYDLYLGGQYTFKLRDLHRVYGEYMRFYLILLF